MMKNFGVRLASVILCSLIGTISLAAPDVATKPPAVGDTAKDFTLTDLSGGSVSLSKVAADSPVVLVVLRGYPGYQCPYCTRQFAEFLKAADRFKSADAQVLFVYPGPADQLKDHAAEFVKGKDFPPFFHLLIDPDYTFTNNYGLRWDAPKETAHPSTFVLNNDLKIVFAKTSTGHGDRTTADEVLKAIPKK